jgi:hypothetical protein
VASMPAVFLYFVGWGYLYFYFASFGINISEINLDTSTVLIYSCNVVSDKTRFEQEVLTHLHMTTGLNERRTTDSNQRKLDVGGCCRVRSYRACAFGTCHQVLSGALLCIHETCCRQVGCRKSYLHLREHSGTDPLDFGIPKRPKDQVWCPKWRETLERVKQEHRWRMAVQ